VAAFAVCSAGSVTVMSRTSPFPKVPPTSPDFNLLLGYTAHISEVVFLTFPVKVAFDPRILLIVNSLIFFCPARVPHTPLSITDILSPSDQWISASPLVLELGHEIKVLVSTPVVSTSGTTVNILNDGYKHVPFVGDKIGVAPEEIGGAMTAVTVTAVKNAVVGGDKVWAVTTNTALAAEAGDVLVEADEEGKMLVKEINAVCPTDLDMFDAAATDDEDFDGARYSYTPALGGIMYTNKMSPLPECVKKLNKSIINGWYQVQSV
jgi:hypothetical protein